MRIILIFVGYAGAYSVSLFYGILSLVYLSVKWLMFKGPDFWKVKPRPVAPACLRNPAYGRHSFIKLPNGLQYHYVENGDQSKPLMLFVHGFPEFWFTWRYQLEYFSKKYWVVAFDMRGYGKSDKPIEVSAYKTSILEQDIHDMVKGLGRDSCILVAHDWGGILSWAVAANYPELVQKLIIMNAPNPNNSVGKIMRSLLTRGHLFGYIKQFFKSWYIIYFQLPYLPELFMRSEDWKVLEYLIGTSITPEELEAYKYTFAQEGAVSGPLNYYRNMLQYMENTINSVTFPKIKAPTLLIWGEDDHYIEKHFSELCKEEVTNLKIEFISKGNHFINQHKPNEVNRLMETFLSKLE